MLQFHFSSELNNSVSAKLHTKAPWKYNYLCLMNRDLIPFLTSAAVFQFPEHFRTELNFLMSETRRKEVPSNRNKNYSFIKILCEVWNIPTFGIVITNLLEVSERWAVLRSGWTSSGSVSCNTFFLTNTRTNQGWTSTSNRLVSKCL